MRKLTTILLTAALITSQATAAHKVVAPAQAAAISENTIALNTQSPNAIQDTRHVPNWDTDVLAPLRAEQAAQKAAALAAQKAKRVVHSVVIAGTDAFAALRICEAGGDYTRNSGNGYYGAYQYNISTWAGYGGYTRPDLAPPAVQDAKAHITQAARGWSPWPACSIKLGLR